VDPTNLQLCLSLSKWRIDGGITNGGNSNSQNHGAFKLGLAFQGT
jgi:hypothetical protein